MNSDAWKIIEERLLKLNVHPRDLKEQFVRSGGHGGQNVNKVATCVVLTHKLSGLSIRCEEERSQNQNRYLARKRLVERLEALERERIAEKKYTAEKIRRQKRKRSKAAKERMLKVKHHRSELKKNRSWRDDQ